MPNTNFLQRPLPLPFDDPSAQFVMRQAHTMTRRICTMAACAAGSLSVLVILQQGGFIEEIPPVDHAAAPSAVAACVEKKERLEDTVHVLGFELPWVDTSWMVPSVDPPRIAQPAVSSDFSSSAASAARSSSPLSLFERRRRERWERADADPRDMQPLTFHEAADDRGALNQVGVFLTAGSASNEDFVADTMTRLQERGGDALVVDVKGSAVYVDVEAPLARELGLLHPLVDLPQLLTLANERGIEVIGRFIAIKDAGITAVRPDTTMRHPRTNGVLSPGWIDPLNDTALAYNMQVLCDLAAAGIHEVNLDYIRFDTATVGALRALSGQEKADRIEVFVRKARETIDRCGPGTRLGLSTYAILGWDYATNLQTLGQDVVRFAPMVDVISPMAYPATFAPNAYYVPGKHPRSRMYYLVFRTLQGYSELLGEHAGKLRPWIQGYGVSARDMREQMDAVVDAGACGFTVWNASNAYRPVYDALKDWQLPERCGGTVKAIATR